jgi:hypothetical protein
MEDAYSFVDAINIKEKVKVLEDTIMAILQQTVECVVFIREYSGRGFGGSHIYCPQIRILMGIIFFSTSSHAVILQPNPNHAGFH